METSALASAARRMLRTLGERAAQDVDALPLLAQLSRDVDDAMRAAVREAVTPADEGGPGWSYTDVARVLGVTRQAAWQRFGTPGRAER